MSPSSPSSTFPLCPHTCIRSMILFPPFHNNNSPLNLFPNYTYTHSSSKSDLQTPKSHPQNSKMNNFIPQTTTATNKTTSPTTPSSLPPPISPTSALTFLSNGYRTLRDSADADIRLIKHRANSIKNLASSELGNFILSPSSSSSSSLTFPSPSPVEIEFVKRLQPKLSEFRRAYSSPDFRKPRIRIDLSAIRNAIVEEAEGSRTRVKFRIKDFRWDWKGGDEDDDDEVKDWEPIRALKMRFKELDVLSKNRSSLSSHDLLQKFKSSLKAFQWESQDSKEVPPLDLPELLAYFVRQSEPFLDHLGVKRDICDKIVESLYSKRKNQLLLQTLSEGESSVLHSDNINDELDLRIASVLQSTGHHYEGGFWSDFGKFSPSDKKRHVAIVTTASLPWMTGTAVNPLFRAAYLAKSANQNVTLLVPWLCQSDQELVYPNSLTFKSPEEQEVYIRNWLEERTGFKADFKISFYPGKFSKERRSIIPTGDTSQFISSKDADIAILEEPEHLNWYHHGKRWTDKFNHVVGVVHTNYLEYIKREKNGAIQAFLVKHINNIVARAYCHKVLRLSAATQDLPKSVVCNVHGVNPKFLEIGDKLASERASGEQAFSKGAYFLGKMVWAKGYRELIDLLSKHRNELDSLKLDVFGNGEDAHEVQSAAKKLNLNLNFQKGRDHADDSLHGYKVFINPSVSDVLCTATAEALAMGKFVVCADHPSNEFFRSFPNCLTYKTSEDFVSKVKEALSKDPQPLTPEQRHKLSWEAATERFMEYSDLDKVLKAYQNDPKSNRKSMGKSVSMPNLADMVDGGLAFAHYCLTGSEILRLATGAIPRSRDYDEQHCKDLNLLPPQVENPIYGW